ncbi:MAG: S-adenosyl-l-methionine hydroxide adenosyltransferase family protein [Bacteroidota bacterium]
MKIITLTTDWGTTDHHVGALKGLLYNVFPDVLVVDITHEIQHYSIQQAAYIFRNVYKRFPEGTVHILAVQNAGKMKPDLLAIKKDGFGFVGMNDGLFSLIFGEQPPSNMVSVKLDIEQKPGFDLEVLTFVATHLLSGQNVFELGNRPDEFVVRKGFEPVLEEDVIRGTVIYIDSFGNVVSNIHRDVFHSQIKDRRFEIIIRKLSVNKISSNYSDVVSGNMIALFNDAGYLEIASNQGQANKLLGVKLNDQIRIDIK